MKSGARAAHDQVEARAAMDDVVAVAGLDVVVAAEVPHDVVAVAGIDDVVAGAALEIVVAAVAEDRVVAFAGDDDVVAFGAAEHDVLVARVLQVVRVRAGRRRVVANHQRRQDAAADRVGALEVAVTIEIVVLPALIHLEDQTRSREHVRRQVRRVGVGHDHFGERVVLHLAEQVQAVEALQVVEAVAVLQALHLHLEHEVERGAEHAAERKDLLGEAADPQVDVVQAGDGDAVCIAGPGARAVEEVDRIGRSRDHSVIGRRARIAEKLLIRAGNDRERRGALAFKRGLAR